MKKYEKPFFCPNKKCRYHDITEAEATSSWYVNHGYYISKRLGRVQRFRCNNRGKTFSARSNDPERYFHETEISSSKILRLYYQDVPIKEIAEKLKTTESIIRTRLKRFLYPKNIKSKEMQVAEKPHEDIFGNTII